MGIANFNKWIRETYPDAIIKFDNIKYDCVYIDLNHILHCCLAGCDTFEQFSNKVCKRLESFINMLNSNKFVIAIDGPAPYPKLLLQRKRRCDNKVITNNNELTPYALTPGTVLIQKIESVVSQKINEMNEHNAFLKIKFETSFSNIDGEGEIKINKKIKEKEGIYNTVLVIGNDADIIVLSKARKIPNIYVYNNSTKVELIDVKKIIAVNNNDFVFISLMLGNDYLPKLCYTTYNTLWQACDTYHFLHKAIINYDFMQKKKYIRKKDCRTLFTFFCILNSLVKPTYAKFNINKYDKKHAKNYIDGLLWSLHLYLDATITKYDYVYNYSNSPTVANIMHYLITNIKKKYLVPISDVLPIDHKHYTIFTIPLSHINLIPKECHDIVNTISKKNLNINNSKDITYIRTLI